MDQEGREASEAGRPEVEVILFDDLKRKRDRKLQIAKGQVPDGCRAETFICQDCSGIMQLVLDENKTIIGIINLRRKTVKKFKCTCDPSNEKCFDCLLKHHEHESMHLIKKIEDLETKLQK